MKSSLSSKKMRIFKYLTYGTVQSYIILHLIKFTPCPLLQEGQGEEPPISLHLGKQRSSRNSEHGRFLDAKIEMKISIPLGAKDLGKAAVFSKAAAGPDHQSAVRKFKGADETLKADEKCEEIEVGVLNSNSGTMVGKSSSDPPTDVHGNMMNIPARNADIELEKKELLADLSRKWQALPAPKSQQSLNVFNKKSADKDLSIFTLIIRSLCNLRHFRDKLLTHPLVWIPSVDNPCIAQKFYEIYYSWEKNDHHLMDVVLTYMKTFLCRILDFTTFSEKVYVYTDCICFSLIRLPTIGCFVTFIRWCQLCMC